MNPIDIIRAWKDAEYRSGLSAEQLAQLPANPAGMIELDDVTLGQVVGAAPQPTSPAACEGTDNRYCTDAGSCDPTAASMCTISPCGDYDTQACTYSGCPTWEGCTQHYSCPTNEGCTVGCPPHSGY